MSGFRRFVGELHRRSVWQVLAIYAGGSWLVIEVIDHLIERLGLPEWSYGAAWVLLLLGLPMIVATAFVQEGTPGRSEAPGGDASEAAGRDVSEAAGPTRAGSSGPQAAAETAGQTGTGFAPRSPTGHASPFEGGLLGLLTWRNALLGGVAAAAIWGVVATVWMLAGPRDGRATDVSADMSLAALPFTNMSADDEDLYFTDGVHEEILAQLARIEALRVISRTSVMGYRGSDRRLRDIAEELDVRYVLEGSVRRFEDRVRITAQLIDADTDAHLWADTYDRPREDLFAIQSEVASEIAGALRAELTPEERKEIARAPTRDMEAHEYYLRGNDALHRGSTPQNIAAAVSFYESAVERDPGFVDALSRLTYAHLLARWLGYDRSPERLAQAEALVTRLVSLAPDAAATRYARGFLHYYGHADFAAAMPDMEAAFRGGATGAATARAYLLRRLGRWEEHIAALDEVRRLDPLDASIPFNLIQTYSALGRYADAVDVAARARALAPSDGRIYRHLAYAHLRAGDLAAAQRAIGSAPAMHSSPGTLLVARTDVLRTARAYDEALRHLETAGNDLVSDQFAVRPPDLMRGWLLHLAGRPAEADDAYRRALASLDSAAVEDPGDFRVAVGAALAHAGLGEGAAAHEAMAEVEAAYPVERDHMGGRLIQLDFARVHARLGEAGEALDLIERLLAEPSFLSVEWLRLDPDWDGLRNHPRYLSLAGEGS